MKMNEKVVFIGAGSAIFTRGTVYDMILHGWEGEVALVDTDPDALKVTEALIRKMLYQTGSKLKLSAATDRRKAFPDATVVISTIAVGGRKARELDVGIPRKYGIFQPVGDSVMAGGTIRAMRMVPEMIAIARDVEKLCPKAVFINYANPMSVNCRAVTRETGVKVVGLCHSVLQTAGHLADCLKLPISELEYTASGVNHLTFFTSLRTKGMDLTGVLMEEAARRVAGIYPGAEEEKIFENLKGSRLSIPLAYENHFSWYFTCLYGAFPAAMDRHVVEFFPELFAKEKAYYGKTVGVDWESFENALSVGANAYAETKALAMSDEKLPDVFFTKLEGEHEQAIAIIESLRQDKKEVFYANLPNEGQVPGVPLGAIVEAPAVVDAQGFHSIICPELASGLRAHLVKHMAWVDLVVDAAVERSRRKLIQALMSDGVISSTEMLEKMADELITANAQYLQDMFDWR